MERSKQTDFHKELKQLMDLYVNKVYDCTAAFPKDEMFGLTSQLKRSSMSVVLNYIEGYARQRKNVFKNFLEISYGSLKESKYLIFFSQKRGLIKKEQYEELVDIAERIGKMIWGIISKMK